MNKSDYVVCYYCTMDTNPDYTYEYLPYTTYWNACLFADEKSGDIAIKKYGDLIKEEAKEYLRETEPYQANDMITVIDDILLRDYIGYKVYRVLPETPKDAIKEDFIDNPEVFCACYCKREA